MAIRKAEALAAAVLSALVVVVLAGCGVVYRNASAWEGHTIGQLIESWGEPDSRIALGQNRKAYTWRGEDGLCEHTFTAQDDKIIGVSDTGCPG